MTTMTMIITTATLISVRSVGLFYLGLRMGLKTAQKLVSGEPLYEDVNTEIEQTHTSDDLEA